MGTRAKQRAVEEQMTLEFTYGVIDKCILRALLGHDSLIMTTSSMAGRVAVRVEAYCKESGNSICVVPMDPAEQSTHTGTLNVEVKENDSSH
jgi:cobalt/nickel transport system ATP-binding protein